MNVAFIEHAQDKIDRNQRRGNQHRLVGQRRLESLGRTLIGGLYTRWHAHFVFHFVHRLDGVAQGYVRRQIERERHYGKLTLVVHGDGNGGGLHVREGIERDLAAIGKRRRGGNRGGDGGAAGGSPARLGNKPAHGR